MSLLFSHVFTRKVNTWEITLIACFLQSRRLVYFCWTLTPKRWLESKNETRAPLYMGRVSQGFPAARSFFCNVHPMAPIETSSNRLDYAIDFRKTCNWKRIAKPK